jgi:hypothetical protein
MLTIELVNSSRKLEREALIKGDYRKVRSALRRALLVAALVACTWIPSLALGQQNNEGLPVIPLNINNNMANAPAIYVYITGILAARSITYPQGTWVYVTDVQGDVSITPPIPVDAPRSLAINVGTGKSTAMMLPKLLGIRIYLSLGQGLMVQTNNSEGVPPSAPCGWCGEGNTENNTNFNTIFEWAELTWVDGPGGTGHETNLGGNVTEVDMLGFPLHLTFHGNDPAKIPPTPVTRDAGFTQSRPQILNAYSALGAPWTNLELNNSTGARLRVLAPYHGIALGIFPADALDSYINSVWTSGTPIRVTAVSMLDGSILHSYIGLGSGNQMIFSENGVAKFQFTKPSTLTVYQNELKPSPPPPDELTKNLAGVVAAKLGGALVRTVVLANPDLDACMTSQFYLNTPVQKYAQFFHQVGINNLAYAYGYDDTCSQSSFILVDAPTAVDITITGTRP